MHKIPVTVVTGFLGAGKTTLLRHILRNNQGRRIAVLVNEFGEVGIDGDLLRSCQICDEADNPVDNIVELTNGCLCCTVQEEFYPTMQKLLERRDKIDCILVETSGLALPQPLVQAFRWPAIRHSATVDGVVTVVDCQALAEGSLVGDLAALIAQRAKDPNLDHETPIEELFEDQLNCADLVLLTKTDLVTTATLANIHLWLKEKLSAGVKIISCQRGKIAPHILLGLNAALEDSINQRPSHHATELEHDHDDSINSVQINLTEQIDPSSLVDRLRNLMQQQEIYRIKGFINVANKPMRLVLQGVGNRFETFYDRLWRKDEVPQTNLVLIGRYLDKNTIETAIKNLALNK